MARTPSQRNVLFALLGLGFLTVLAVALLVADNLLPAGSQADVRRAFAQAEGVSSWWMEVSQQTRRSDLESGEVLTFWNSSLYEIAPSGEGTRWVMETWTTTRQAEHDEEVVLPSACGVEERIFFPDREFVRCGDGPWDVIDIPEEYRANRSEYTVLFTQLDPTPENLINIHSVRRDTLRGIPVEVFEADLPAEKTSWYRHDDEQLATYSEADRARIQGLRQRFLETAQINVTLYIGDRDSYLYRYVIHTEFETTTPVIDIVQVDLFDFNEPITVEAPDVTS